MALFGPGMGTFDYDAETVTFWGDGTQPIEVTSVEDTARMAARVALDRTVPSGKFAFAGDRVSFREAAGIVGRQVGRELKPVSYGSEDDLRATMAKADPEKRIMLAYLLYMTNSQTALSDLRNERYPDIRFESFADFAARMIKVPVEA